MATWGGALIEVAEPSAFSAVAPRYRIASEPPTAPWLLATCEGAADAFQPRRVAKALSRDLRASVIAFLVRPDACTEEIEHWENGVLRRSLAYSRGEGGWRAIGGAKQAWEEAYFFDDAADLDEGEWPANLATGLTHADLDRYLTARARHDATPVMGLLAGGGAAAVRRLCARFAVDPERPTARFAPTRLPAWAGVAAVVAAVLVVLAMEALRVAP